MPDAWLDENDYPDEKDIDEFGEDAPPDFEPQTIGFVGNWRPPFWTPRRLVFLIIGGILITLLVLGIIYNPF
jgi:hypothetical protein